MSDKREKKTCENCGNLFGRQVYKNGDVQSSKGFERRKFCSLTCSAIVRNRKAAMLRLEKRA